MPKKLLAVLLFIAVCSAPAWAVPKEIIALQQQVALLMAEVQDLQKGFNANVAVIKALIGQNADTINKVQLAVASLQQTVQTQAANNGQQQGQFGQQFQNLNDAISDLQARVNKMNETLTQIQQQQQTLQAPQQQPQQPAANAPGAEPGTAPGATGAPAAPTGAAAGGPPVLAAGPLYTNALSDYVAGSYPLAASEFQQFLANYPGDGHAPEATFYLGDIYSKERKYGEAVKMFDNVLNNFPDNKLASGAELKKGYALEALKERSAAIREFRSLIGHYPHSPEASQAREELIALGVSASVR